ncbi:MAG: hypothetical protein AAGD10_21855 [Myxococcota bacterium]
MENVNKENAPEDTQATPIEVTRVEVDLHRKDLESQFDSFRRKTKSYAQELWRDGRGMAKTGGQFIKAWISITTKQARNRLKLAT